MASSGSSPESHRAHRRREPGRSSRSRDEVDYSDDDNTALPSINPPPVTEIASGSPVLDPSPPRHRRPSPSCQHLEPRTFRTTSYTTPPTFTFSPIPLPRPHVSTPPQFPPSPPTHLTSPHFPPPRLQAPRPRPPLSHPRTTGPPPPNPYAPRPRPRQPLSQPPTSRDHRSSRSPQKPFSSFSPTTFTSTPFPSNVAFPARHPP